MNAADSGSPVAAPRIPFDGPQELRGPVMAALGRVVDPELALTIVDVGLVHGVTIAAGELRVRLTMTSAACPVADTIMEDVRDELSRVLPLALSISTELVWEPEWTPDRMSERARKAMGW